MTADPDHDLMEGARTGDPDALGALFARRWPDAWRVAFGVTGSRVVADDVAQDAFERAITHLHRFDGRRPFAAWLHRIVVNRARDVLRRERRLGPLVGEEGTDGLEGQRAAESGEVRAALARLDVDRREVVVLHYWLGYPLPEVAEILSIPVGTVHSRLSRALRDLREMLEAEDVGRAR